MGREIASIRYKFRRLSFLNKINCIPMLVYLLNQNATFLLNLCAILAVCAVAGFLHGLSKIRRKQPPTTKRVKDLYKMKEDYKKDEPVSVEEWEEFWNN